MSAPILLHFLLLIQCYDLTEIASDLSKIADTSNLNCISITPGSSRPSTATSYLLEPSFAFCLPPELLAAIFLEYVQSYRHVCYSTEVPPWVAVSYVCRYWRDVALDCADLWTYLFFVSSKWTDELLRRSKTAPLTVHIDLSLFPITDLDSRLSGTIGSLDKTLENVERIQDLWIGCLPNYMDDIFHYRPVIAAVPLLRSLRLSQHFTLSDDIGAMPSLQKVYLERCYVDWSSSIFSGLTELTLDFIQGSCKENWHGLLLILRQLPCLNQLTLAEVLDNPFVTNISSIVSENTDKPISLPQLETFSLSDSCSWAVALLARLEFPRSTVFQLQSCYHDDPETISELLSLIVDNFGSHPSLLQSATSAQIVFQYLAFCRNATSMDVEYGTSSRTNTHGTSTFSWIGQEIGSQILLNREFGGLDLHGILSWLRAFPLAHINVMILQNLRDDVDDKQLWEEVFLDTPELHIILVEFGYIDDLTRALHPRGSVVPVPTLTDIGFRYIDFERGECLGGQDHFSGQGCLPCLHSALASRAEAGIALQKLEFQFCTGITREDVAEFSKVVRLLDLEPEHEYLV